MVYIYVCSIIVAGNTFQTVEFQQSLFYISVACPDCYQEIEGVYDTSLLSLNATEDEIQNLTTAAADLTPFDDRVLYYQNNISNLQAAASALVTWQNELLLIYGDVLFAVNVTLRNRINQISSSFDVLERSFTTVYVTTFTTQELVNTLMMEFQAAIDVVSRIEMEFVPSIRNHSEAIQNHSAIASDVAQRLNETRANFSAEVEDLRNATYQILALSASLLGRAADLVVVQEEIMGDIQTIVSNYSSLDSEIAIIDFNLTDLELDLINLTNRLRQKYNSQVEIPAPNEIIYLTMNATEMEAFIRGDLLNDIMNQGRQLSALNDTYAAYRSEFDDLFQEVSDLGLNVSMLLQRIQAAYREAAMILNNAQELVNDAEMIAENLESFNNSTFQIGEQVASAMSDIESVNRNATMALSEAQRLQEALRNYSDSLRIAKQVASDALNITNSSFQVHTCS